MGKKNSKQTDPIPPYISCKRAILKTISNGLKERIKNESIEAKMPVYKNKWQNDVINYDYDRILNDVIKTGIYEGMPTPSHTGIIKDDQQVYYANVLLKFCEFFDNVIKNYPIAKDKNDFLIKVEYDFYDFLLKTYLWAGIIPEIEANINRIIKSNETLKNQTEEKKKAIHNSYIKLVNRHDNPTAKKALSKLEKNKMADMVRDLVINDYPSVTKISRQTVIRYLDQDRFNYYPWKRK